MRGWWLRYPELLQRETDALEARGIPYHLDPIPFSEGRLILKVDYPFQGQSYTLTAEYPDSYPYFMPAVFGNVGLVHHQNPVSDALCLLAEQGNQWRPYHDTLASLLEEQFPQLMQANSADPIERAAANQEEIAEPLSAFLLYLRPSQVLHPGWSPPHAWNETGTFLAFERPVRPTERVSSPFQTFAVVSNFKAINGQELISFPLADALKYPNSITGFWFRLWERPPLDQSKQLADYLLARLPNELKQRLPLKGSKVLLAACYEDEVAQGTRAMEWLFLAAHLMRRPDGSVFAGTFNYLPSEIATLEYLQERVPEVKPLSGKRVLVVGLGSLGSPVVVELARAGVGTLEIIDHDYVGVGNTVRWALGWESAGQYKAAALAEYVGKNYPYTTVIPRHLRLGAAPLAVQHPDAPLTYDAEVLESAIQQADIVIDATAEFRCHHFLADLCTYLQRPYLWLSTSHGGWGGRIGRVIPASGQGCYHCAMLHVNDGTIPPVLENGEGGMQARGCADRTFTGAGVDASSIALQAVRLALGTLCRGHTPGYPDAEWNLAVISLRDSNGAMIFPQAQTFSIEPHSKCSCQRQHSG